MGKAIPVILRSKTFRNKTVAMAYFKEMLNRYSDGDIVNTNDRKELCELLELHPEAPMKIGCGIEEIFRDVAPEPTTSCFWLKRTDSTIEDFSFYCCIRAAR